MEISENNCFPHDDVGQLCNSNIFLNPYTAELLKLTRHPDNKKHEYFCVKKKKLIKKEKKNAFKKDRRQTSSPFPTVFSILLEKFSSV